MKFTKEHTMQMKGIAIIILLFHHCFLNAQRWATVPYEKLATTKGWGYYPISFAPFSSHTIQYLASFSKICVAMFVFMTGYGMWVSYESQKKKTTMSNYIKKRMVTLMTGFLIIFVVTEILAIPTGRFIEVYGHDFRSVVYMIIDALGLAKLLGTPLFCLTWWYIESCDRFDHDLSICTFNYGKISMGRGCCIYYRSKSLWIWTINRFVPISISIHTGNVFCTT